MNISANMRRLPASTALEGQSNAFPRESTKYIPRILENRVVVETLAAFLDLKSIQELSQTCRITREITSSIGPSSLSVTRTPLAASGPCLGVFLRWGKFIQSLTLHATPFADRATLPTLLGYLPNLKKLTIQDCPTDPNQWEPDSVLSALLSMPYLEELRLHYSDNMQYDESPYNAIIQAMASDVQYCTPPAAGGGASAQATAPGNRLVVLSSSTTSDTEQSSSSDVHMEGSHFDPFQVPYPPSLYPPRHHNRYNPHTPPTYGAYPDRLHSSTTDPYGDADYPRLDPASTISQSDGIEAFPLSSVHPHAPLENSTAVYRDDGLPGRMVSSREPPRDASRDMTVTRRRRMLSTPGRRHGHRHRDGQGTSRTNVMMDTDEPGAVSAGIMGTQGRENRNSRYTRSNRGNRSGRSTRRPHPMNYHPGSTSRMHPGSRGPGPPPPMQHHIQAHSTQPRGSIDGHVDHTPTGTSEPMFAPASSHGNAPMGEDTTPLVASIATPTTVHSNANVGLENTTLNMDRDTYFPDNPFLSPVSTPASHRESDTSPRRPGSTQQQQQQHSEDRSNAAVGTGENVDSFPSYLDGLNYEYNPGYYPPYQLLQEDDESLVGQDTDESTYDHEEGLSTYDGASIPFANVTDTDTDPSAYTTNTYDPPFPIAVQDNATWSSVTSYPTMTTPVPPTSPVSIPPGTARHHAPYRPESIRAGSLHFDSSQPEMREMSGEVKGNEEQDTYPWVPKKGGFSISSRFSNPTYLCTHPFSRSVREMRVSAKKTTRRLKDTRKPFSRLKKLTLFTRLNVQAATALAKYLSNPERSRSLEKLKLSTSLISSPGGSDVLSALSHHCSLKKLTIMRPDGVGEPIRKSQCSLVAQAMVNCKTLSSVHLRRAGMWFDTLASLVPPVVCPQIKNLKLDSNSLAYLSSGYFNDAMDTLLSRVPNLQTLHLGNNQLDGTQAISLANSIVRHKVNKLETLTLGSNNIGDRALAAILRALPPTMKQLYLHGCDIHDDGLRPLKAALDRMPNLWGLGLNGNPITDEGVQTLCEAIRNRSSLRDIGATLSEMTDEGVEHLSHALSTCENLRFVYLYTSGFKASTRVTKEGREILRRRLPKYCTPAFDHRLSRYLKTP